MFSATDVSERASDRWAWPRWMIAALLAGHALVACWFLPPVWFLDDRIYVGNDYPVHAHRTLVYREALVQCGLPWGIDPQLCAGRVIHPAQDVGARPHEVLGALLPFVAPDKIVFGFTMAAVLLCPALFVLGGRLLRFDWDELSVALLILIGMFWIAVPFQFMLTAGMLAFVLCNFLGLVVLGAYWRFFRRPTWQRYVGATASGALLFLVHPLGPLAILLPLIVGAAFARLDWRWRVATALSPVLIGAANAFWLVPLVLGLDTPAPPWSHAMIVDHAFWTWNETYRFSDFVGPPVAAALGLMLLAVTFQLANRSRRDASTSAALALVFGGSLFLFLLGSEFEITRQLQPVRYCIGVLTISALLLGSLAADFNRRVFLPRPWSRGALIGLQALGVVGVIAGCFYLGPRLIRQRGEEALCDFVVQRTRRIDRLLIESESEDSSLTQVVPMYTGRETISAAFPDYPDPVQFLPDRLFDQTADDLSTREVRRGLTHFGVDWAFVRSEQWRALFQSVTGEPGEAVGPYLAFRIPGNDKDLLIGSGRAKGSVNRIRMRDLVPRNGVVVLRYRYHPAWVCDGPSRIEPFAIPEDPGGLLLIRDPRPEMELRFDPVKALEARWQEKSERPSGR